METSTKFKTVDEYHAAVPAHIRTLLEDLRKTIKQAAPKAEEVISYNMPAFKQKGILVYYAAWKEHIGFYPTTAPLKVFEDELRDYKTSKGAIQFPIQQGIPRNLVKKIVAFRVKANLEKAELKIQMAKTR
jgi:uncharacterized protein YdhG (YjbR/CyaY superfamily)